jgi:hypothetical protein
VAVSRSETFVLTDHFKELFTMSVCTVSANTTLQYFTSSFPLLLHVSAASGLHQAGVTITCINGVLLQNLPDDG